MDTPSGTQALIHRQMEQVLGPSAPPPAHGAKGGAGGPPAGGLISWAPAQPPAGYVASCGYATDRSEAKLRAPVNCAAVCLGHSWTGYLTNLYTFYFYLTGYLSPSLFILPRYLVE